MPTKNEITNIKSGEVYFNGVCVGVATDIEIGDFVEDRAAVKAYIRENAMVQANFKCTVKLDLITYFKLNGLWNWIRTYCPNKRLTYLMDHGKNSRVRLKNFKRAIRELDKYIK